MKIPKEIKYNAKKLNCSNCDFIVNKNIDIKTVKEMFPHEHWSYCFCAFIATIIKYYPTNYKHIINKIIKYYNDMKLNYVFPCCDTLIFNEGKPLKFIFNLLEVNDNNSKLEIE